MTEKAGFQQSTMTGPNVVILRPAIVNLNITAPDTMQPGVNSFAASAGSMTLDLEIIDSMSKKVIARIYDASSGDGSGEITWSSGVGNEQAADYAIDQRAHLIRDALQHAREAAGESPDCSVPGAGKTITPLAK